MCMATAGKHEAGNKLGREKKWLYWRRSDIKLGKL